MSYKTNPIQNRIKINKGWKNPYLPTKTLNYSQETLLWFKVYLLLKLFLNLKKIQLVSCEIRFDEQNKKILYLRINKKGSKRKKRRKKISVLQKFLKKMKTPLLIKKNAKAIFFLYKYAINFKNLSFWNQNPIQKKILTQFWLTKPQDHTWLSTLKKIALIRHSSIKTTHYLKKNKIFIPRKQLKSKLYVNKQKQILATLARVKKRNFVLFLKFFALIQKKKTKVLQCLLMNLKKQIIQNQIHIQKINSFYKFFIFSIRKSFVRKEKFSRVKYVAFQPILRSKLDLILKTITRKLISFRRFHFLKHELFYKLSTRKKRQFKLTYKRKLVLEKDPLLIKIWYLNFLTSRTKKNDFLIKNHFLYQNSVLKSKSPNTQNFLFETGKINVFFQKKIFHKKKYISKEQKLFYSIALWNLLRKKKRKKRAKRKLSMFFKKAKFALKKREFQVYKNFLIRKKNLKKTKKYLFVKKLQKLNKNLRKTRKIVHYKYRLPYRKTYFSFLKIITNFKLKFLIQDFIQKYFRIQIEAKIVHVLNTHKNQNFFRLIFPLWKKKRIQFIKKKRLNIWKQKQIFLPGQLKLSTTFNNQVKLIGSKKNFSRILDKEDILVLLEKKKLKRRISNNFRRIKNNKDFRNIFKYFIPSLIEFSRSFEPKILADILAKVIRKAKKQTAMLNTVKQILQGIQLPKNVGYKIVLTGRINSKKKSRLIYITRNQITLQIFANNMNYAYSQAEARIGTFGVKIWVYSIGKKKEKNEKSHRITSE